MRYYELFEEKRPELLSQVPNIRDIQKLGDLFAREGYELRLVGGVVRDLIQSKKPKDVDLASNATPDEMVKLAEKYKLKTIPTGLQHGTLTFVINGEGYEITTLRIDAETDGRHARVEYTKDWQLDAERRDLTFNAMSMDLSGELYDYFDGERDLKSGTARFVGDAEKRIQEDYLRILRYFRFQGRTSNPKWDEETLTAIKKNADGLNRISGERIWMEMEKILSGAHVKDIIEKMKATGVFERIGLKGTGDFIRVVSTGNGLLILASLVSDESNLKEIRERWKFDGKTDKVLSFIITNRSKKFDFDNAKRWIILNKGDKDLIALLALYQGNKSLSQEVSKWVVPEFPVTGEDLKAKGFKPGPEFGKELNRLKAEWVNSGFSLSKEELLSPKELKDWVEINSVNWFMPKPEGGKILGKLSSGDLIYGVAYANKIMYFFAIDKEDKSTTKAYIALEEYDEDLWIGRNAFTDKQYKGNNLASELFAFVNLDLGMKIISDTKMTKDGIYLWHKLAKNPQIKTKIVYLPTKEIFDISDVGRKKTKDGLVVIHPKDDNNLGDIGKEGGQNFFLILECIKSGKLLGENFIYTKGERIKYLNTYIQFYPFFLDIID